MKFFSKAKDGGPESPVDAYFIFEIKSFFSIALLKFNKGGRENFHTHAFNAWTWFIKGDMFEEDYNGIIIPYTRSVIPKFTSKAKNHRVVAKEDSWCFTVRGPWDNTWTEDSATHKITLTHGRKVVEVKNK